MDEKEQKWGAKDGPPPDLGAYLEDAERQNKEWSKVHYRHADGRRRDETKIAGCALTKEEIARRAPHIDWDGVGKNMSELLGVDKEEADNQLGALEYREFEKMVKKDQSDASHALAKQNRERTRLKPSITKAIRHLFKLDPSLPMKLAKNMIDLANGDVDRTRQPGMLEALKVLMDRVDGPVIKKIDTTLRADKTVIAHDGPAVLLDDNGKIIEGKTEPPPPEGFDG